jgi:23S rRNA (adenine-N6)-dimethyltransferase
MIRCAYRKAIIMSSATLRYSQNFLHNEPLVKRLVKRADIPQSATVLEIGAGKGIITQALTEAVPDGRVVAVELDAQLVRVLKIKFNPRPNVQILFQDIRIMDLTELGADYHVFSNVPFNITSELLEHLLTGDNPPIQAHLILQKDTLISASPYGDGETFKSLMIAPRYEVTLNHVFQPSDFAPRPSVDTVLFGFKRRDEPLIAETDYLLYKDFLAHVSKDRVGEGAWLKILPKKTQEALAETSGLVFGRGLKSQTLMGMMNAFQAFKQATHKHAVVEGAMGDLREEQFRREQINQSGGHHRSKKRRKP